MGVDQEAYFIHSFKSKILLIQKKKKNLAVDDKKGSG